MKEDTGLSNQEMVKEVDNYIEKLGLSDEILGLKTIQDKVLYYYNYIYPKNIFKGVVKLHSCYFIKLANLLCNTAERLREFQNKFYNPDGNIAEQFRQYRRYLLDTRENTDEFLGVMQKMIKGECFAELYGVIEELFFEPFEKWIYNEIVEMIHNDCLSAEDMYQWYKSGKNIKAIITFK